MTTKEAGAVARVAHPNLPAALAAFQAELPQVRKTSTADAGTYKYSYADLSDVSAAAMPLLGKHGLSFSARPTVGDNGFVLFYKLAHESGESEEGIYPLPSPNTPPQQMGSAITYARRYAFCAVTGVAPGGDDDDATAAQSAPPQAQRRQQPARQQRIAPQKATRDWAAEAEQITSLERLTVLAEEAVAAGEMGVRIGEGTVFDALTARKTALESPPLTEDAGTPAKDRNWVAEARALKSRDDARQLIQEATVAGAPAGTITAMETAVQGLADTAPTEPAAGWATAEIPKDGAWNGEGEAPVEEVPFG